MATVTPNFGWDVPQSTDLVKDGATAIAALGNDIDASLVDLKGGTTGQVLSKASNTDMDFTWSSVDPLTILDAKGDLISATAADSPARLAVGTNGQVLTADSTTATGLKWATASSSPTTAGATVADRQGTSSTSYTDLTTSGPAVTLTTGTKVLVIVTSAFDNDLNAGQPGVMDFAISGATTRSASLTTAAKGPGISLSETNAPRYSTAIYLTGITAGSNTFTAKYRSWNGGTVYWKDREIFVMDMGS